MRHYASHCDPNTGDGASIIKSEASKIASTLAEGHYPHAVIEDRAELRELADKQCQKWWLTVENSVNYKRYYAELSRLFVPTFAGIYMEKVRELGKTEEEGKAATARREAEHQERERREAERREREGEESDRREAETKELMRRLDAEKAERERQLAEVERGVVVGVTGRRFRKDGIVYSVEFFDPFRMTEAVVFGVSVGEDGIVELEEVEEPDDKEV